jgi:hypothetical protein
MAQQPELTSPSLPASPAQQPAASPASTSLAAGAEPQTTPGKHPPQRIPRWLERAELFLRVLLRMYIGIFICYAPWSGYIFRDLPWSRALWDHNMVWGMIPGLGAMAANGAVRGLISGLGLLNLWIAFQDAIGHGTEKQ